MGLADRTTCRDCDVPFTDENTTPSYRTYGRCRKCALRKFTEWKSGHRELNPPRRRERRIELPVLRPPANEIEERQVQVERSRSPVEQYRLAQARDPYADLWRRILYTPVVVEDEG